MVEQKKLPEGGLEEMQQQMLRELERMMALTDAELWVEREYYHAAGVVLAIMYLFSPQGRIVGIQTMLLRQTIEIFERGFTDTGNIVILISRALPGRTATNSNTTSQKTLRQSLYF